jgi:hypothetical protein
MQVADVGGLWELIPRERRWVEVSAFAYLLAALLFLFEVFERRTGWLAARQGRPPNGEPARAGEAPGVDIMGQTAANGAGTIDGVTFNAQLTTLLC